jgi:hypothetical protein
LYFKGSSALDCLFDYYLRTFFGLLGNVFS